MNSRTRISPRFRTPVASRRLAVAAAGLVLACGHVVGVANAQVVPAELPDGPPAWATPVEQRNAAIAYFRAWMAHGDAGVAISEAMSELDNGYEFPAGSPMDDLLIEHQDYVADLIAAAMIPQADWEIQYERGVYAMLPHLGRLRNSARLLIADASRLARDGDVDGAALRLAAVYGVARHSRPDRVIISSLVSTAITALANQQVEALLARGDLTQTARERLLDAVEQFEQDDPFWSRKSLRAEGEMMTGWIRDRYTGTTAGADLLNDMVEMGGSGEGFDDRLTNPLFYADGQALRAQLRLMYAFYRDTDAIWDEADAQDRFTVMQQGIHAGMYGSLGKIMVPAMKRFHSSAQEGEAELRNTIKLIREAPVVNETELSEIGSNQVGSNQIDTKVGGAR